MKNAALLVTVVFAATIPFAASAAETPPKWTVQLDPLTTAIGFVHLQVERAIAPSWSVYAGPHLRLFDGILEDANGPYIGIGAELGMRWFFYGVAPEGAWVQVRGVGAWLQTRYGAADIFEQEAFGGYVSALAGYTAIFNGWFVLSGGAGVQYLHYRVGGLGPEGFAPALHTAVGVAF